MTTAEGTCLGLVEGHEGIYVDGSVYWDNGSEKVLFIEPISDKQCRIYYRSVRPYNYQYEPRPDRHSSLINENARTLQQLLITGGLQKVDIRTTLGQRIDNFFNALFNTKAAETQEIKAQTPETANVIPIGRPKPLANGS